MLTTRRRGRTALAAAVVLLAAGLVWGLAGALASSDSPSPAAGKTILRLGWTNDPDSLNPFIGLESSSYEIWALNYDLLVGFRASDLATVPGIGLATGWETSTDGKVWTFTITDKARWQDGEPLTASDVAFTYNYVIDNDMGLFIDYVQFITKVEATDATHVVFTCSKPKANMLGLWIPILPEHVWSKIKPADAEKSFKNPPPIVGSGPFQVVEVKKGSFVRMVANKDYWKGAPKIDEVIFQTYQNQDTMAQDLKTGAIQSGWNIPSAQYAPLDSEPDLTSIRAVTIGYNQLNFNCADKKDYPKSTGNPVLTDPAFRKALQWAIDKEKIVAIAYSGNAAPADTIVTRDYYSDSADYHWTPPAGEAYTFDLEKAKAALDAAGYKDTDGDGTRDYKGKPIKLRLFARAESPENQNCRQAHHGLAERHRTRHRPAGDRRRRDHRQGVRLRGRRVRARLRHGAVGLGRRRRPQLHPLHHDHGADRELERLQLVRCGVRQALPRAADDDRPAGAHRHREADAADRVRRVPVHPARLSA